jgi:hypothetical protein
MEATGGMKKSILAESETASQAIDRRIADANAFKALVRAAIAFNSSKKK